jgi:hypothetical protein
MDTLYEGMTKRQVRRVLGRPDSKTSFRAFLRATRGQGGSVVALGRIPNDRFWLYLQSPPGYRTQVIFRRGRVAEIRAVPTGD